MATWSPDNVVVTQQGNAVLSKVQAGVGKLTVSKVVCGGGYVSPSALYNQTTVTNIKQTMTIIGVTTDEDGSEIAVALTNVGLAAEYDLYQIGVYVTHPDFAGEVLYMLAQCNTDKPDHIPLPSVTPVSLCYSLYMEHSGTTNIAITVSPEGFLTVAMKDTSGGVAGLDVNGKLSSPSVVPGSTVYYGSCATDLATAAKVATVSDTSFTLRSGVRLSVKFSNGFCAETVNPNTITLNVNSLGAIAITGFSTASTIKTSASCVLSFIYDGTNFQLDGFEVDSATSTIPGVVKISDSITGNAPDIALSQAAGAALKALSNTKLGFITTALSTLSALVATLTGPTMCFAAFSDGPVTTPCSYVVYPEFSSGALTGKIYVEAVDVAKQVLYILYKTSYASIASTDWKKAGGSSACYAACSTAAATAAKVVTVSDFTADRLVAGLTVNVFMSPANTVAAPTLNISSTGAKAVYDANGVALTATTASLLSGMCVLVYDGTEFCLVRRLSTDTVLGEVLLSDSTSSTSDVTSGIAATPKAVKLAFDLANSAQTKAVYAGICATDAATGAKVVTCAAFTAPTGGEKIVVKFSATNTATSVSININSTGAKSVFDSTGAAINAVTAGLLSGFVLLEYDATLAGFALLSSVASATVMGEVLLSDSYSSTSAAANGVAATPVAVKAAYDRAIAEGKKATLYGTCATAAATTAKVVTCADFTLIAGAKIVVNFTNANSVAGITLNVNSTGAITVVDQKLVAISSAFAAAISGDVTFVYDGTYFVANSLVASASNYGQVQLSDSVSSTSGVAGGVAATPAAVKSANDAAAAANTAATNANTAAIHNSLATAPDLVLVSSASATWAAKTLTQFKTWLALAAANISDFATTVRSTTLTGLSAATNTAITAADTVLSAFGKLQAQVSNLGTTIETLTPADIGVSDTNIPLSAAVATALGLTGNPQVKDALLVINTLANSKAMIETSSYTGTGTFGAANPMSFTFSGTPKLIVVTIDRTSSASYRGGRWICGILPTDYASRLALMYYSGSQTLEAAMYSKLNEKTISWYSTANSDLQLNVSGVQYTIWALY